MGEHTSHYLTFMFMFDKQSDFPLINEKSPLPSCCQIDDNVSAVSCKTPISGRERSLQWMLSL